MAHRKAETLSLFQEGDAFPDGFSYVPDFLTADQERYLIDSIALVDLKPMIFQGFEAKRKTASFGYDYSFDSRLLSKGKPIPMPFEPLIAQVAAHLGMERADVAELLITQYPIGAVINWHRDAPPFQRIIGISLRGDCIFRLRPHDKTLQGRKSILSVPVRRRSLYVLEGQARSEWQHSTLPVTEQRLSITLRTLLPGVRNTMHE